MSASAVARPGTATGSVSSSSKMCAARERLLGDTYVPQGDDPLAAGERAFALTPTVQLLEQRLKPVIKEGQLPPVPQSLIEMKAWNALAFERGFISQQELDVLDAFARDGDLTIQVDDFAPDFDRQEIVKAAQARELIV